MNNLTSIIKQNHEVTTILDLPTELIEYICSCDAIQLSDIFNLATCHSKLNNSLFHEQNSVLWKSKYIQRFGPLRANDFEIEINEKNTWRDEISLRLSLNKKILNEINEMPSKFLKYKNVPYHLLPFTEHLHSNYESHRFYVLSFTSAYYTYLLSNDCCNANYDLLYMTNMFLIYSSQVYFGYKLKEFLCIPVTEKIAEQGFYLLGRWWSPTDDTSYWDMNNRFNGIAIKVCETILELHPQHPIVGKESTLGQIYERGQRIIDHDLFNESNTITILDCLRQVLFANRDIVCYCNRDVNCYLMQRVVERQKGSVFILCVIYESVARRLGVKVKLTITTIHHFLSWSSSWPGNTHANTTYLIDIDAGGAMREATICPITKKLPKHFQENSTFDLFWSFSKIMEQVTMENLLSYKFVLDFQKILRPDDLDVQYRYNKFHDRYNYCFCPLLRDKSNTIAPIHDDVKNTIYTNWEDIFPLVPQTRGTTNIDPKYSIGMMIQSISSGSSSQHQRTKCGIIVGWTRVQNTNTATNKTIIQYHVLLKPDNIRISKCQSPVIYSINDNKKDKIKRQLDSFDYNFKNIGKFFKHYSYDLYAFVPINDLAKLYPDDHSFTVQKSRKIKNKTKLSSFVPKF